MKTVTEPDRRDAREGARDLHISPLLNRTTEERLATVQDLLEAIRRREPGNSHLLKMLGSTVAHISIHLGVPADRLELRKLLDVKPGLQAHLKERGFKKNSIRSYTNYLRILLREANAFGWSACGPEIASAWRDISAVMAGAPGCAAVWRYAIRKGLHPKEFSEADLEHWAEEALQSGLSHEWILNSKRRFRKTIFAAGLNSLIPNLRPPTTGRIYGVRLSEFPDDLRREVIDLLQWKTDEFSPGRPYKARHRAVTATSLKALISRVFGYLVRVEGRTVHDLTELFSQQSLSGFVKWLINQRTVSGRVVSFWLGTIRALRIYPPLQGQNFDWVLALREQLPRDFDVRAKEKKEQRSVPYDTLAAIPEQILQGVDRNGDLNRRARALVFRDALLLRWLVTLPWRQRNIRECKILAFADGGNLFKAPVPPNSALAKPAWLEDALHANRHEPVWQFRFRPPETKNGRMVHAVLPRQLIGPLEEYLANHRPLLVKGSDPHTLFIGEYGTPFRPITVRTLVENLTYRYAGKRVNPHLFRDSFAVKWLEDHPEDYLTLSKILWHSNIQTTLQIYGRGFDESHGARRVDEWLDEREVARKRESV